MVVGRGCGEQRLHPAALRDPVELGSQLRIARAGHVNAAALGERSQGLHERHAITALHPVEAVAAERTARGEVAPGPGVGPHHERRV